MTGVTPGWGLPYPEQSTLITDSAAIVQELAEKIDTALSAVTASDEYTVPGTLLQEFTTTGIFRPSAGVTLVHVVVIGGGAGGVYLSEFGSPGGSGGGVRVYRNVPVSDPVEVIIGGSNTGSAFGELAAPAGYRATGGAVGVLLAVWSPNMVPTDDPTTRPSCGGASSRGPIAGLSWSAGYDGVQVNGTYYGGGGGGGQTTASGGVMPGGAGGGGSGAMYNGSSSPKNGANGLGGGGGGGSYGKTTTGGSGRVMVYTEQTLLSTLDLPPANTDPLIVAALDDQGVMTGAYAIDITTRELPAHLKRVVDYPLDPVETGRTEIALVDPENPTGPTAVVPILAWPEAGWKYTNNTWEEPKNE